MTNPQTRLKKAYRKYQLKKADRKSVLSYLRSFMPEMIFRTTRLEGENVSRRGISSLFK